MKKAGVVLILLLVIVVVTVEAATTLQIKWVENTLLAKNTEQVEVFHVYKNGNFQGSVQKGRFEWTVVASIDPSWTSIEVVGMDAEDQVVGNYYKDLTTETPTPTGTPTPTETPTPMPYEGSTVASLEFIPSNGCLEGSLKLQFSINGDMEMPIQGIQFHLYAWGEDATFSNNVTHHKSVTIPWESHPGKTLFEVVTDPDNPDLKNTTKKTLKILPDCSGEWKTVFLPIVFK